MKRVHGIGPFVIGAAIIGVAVAVGFLVGGGGSRQVGHGRELRSRVIADGGRPGQADGKRVSGKRRNVLAVSAEKQVKVKPDFRIGSDEDLKLSAEMKRIFAELQEALDADDKKRVFALVHRLQAMDEWPDGIPKSIKMMALDALAWFGADGFSEGVGFLADSDPEVVSEAIGKFEDMLDSTELGDRGVSEILKQIVKVVHDHDALDTFYMELNNMRDTVKAETALAILDSKNPDAISVFKENVEFIFGDADAETEITTREDIEKFYEAAVQANKDDPEQAADDEEFYGPPKD